MSEDVIVGIDGGGSKTLVASADRSGNVVSLTRGKATSPLESKSWDVTLGEQVQPFAASGPLAIAAALPAHGEVEEVSEAQRQVIRKLFGDIPQAVLNDVDAAHIGAFAGRSGILILAGTGSMGWARDAAGSSYRTGGWGEVIGDDGSGYWIGKRVLNAFSKSVDGRAGPTALVDGVIELLGFEGKDKVNELEGWVSRFTAPRTQIASLAPVALRLAETGDEAARAIIEASAEELVLHVRMLERKLAAPMMNWSYAGGLFSSPALKAAVIDRVGRPPNAPLLPPIGGSLVKAAQLAGWPVHDAFVTRLATSLAARPEAGFTIQ